MKITEANLKLWSTIGSRATFGMAALALGEIIDELMILTGDTSTSAGLDRFKKIYPEKFLDVGIAEQNMMGIAAGLASEGFHVFTSTFAPFQTMRCCEQIKVNLGYMRHKVVMIGLASGVVLGTLGFTHCCIEDIAVMRAIPGVTVISPADCGETYKAALSAISYPGSIYIRLTGGSKNPSVYTTDFDFTIGKANVLREGNDVAIIATGTMVYESLKAAELLSTHNISTMVVDMHTIKPIDSNLIRRICNTVKLISTVEEHSVIGGLGSAIAEYKTTLKNAPPQLLLGWPDNYGHAGEYADLLKHVGLTAEKIANQILLKFYE